MNISEALRIGGLDNVQEVIRIGRLENRAHPLPAPTGKIEDPGDTEAVTSLRSAIRLAPAAWAKQPVNATPSSWRVSALPPLHFRYRQISPRNAISVPVRALPGSP